MNRKAKRLFPDFLLVLCLIALAGIASWATVQTVHLGSLLNEPSVFSDPSKIGGLVGFLTALAILVVLLSASTAFLLWRLIQTTIKFDRALAISRQGYHRYRLFAEAPPSVGMVRIALSQGKFLDANRIVFKMLGLARGEFVGRSLDSFVCNEDKREFQRQINKLKEGQRSLEFTARMVCSSGDTKDIQWHMARTQTVAGPEPEAVAILTDVSDRRQAEIERAEKERLQGVLEMAGAAAHELNQPIQVIMGYSSILSARIDRSDPNCELIDKLQKEVDRMGEIGKKIAAISRYKVKPYVGDTRIIDIDQASS